MAQRNVPAKCIEKIESLFSYWFYSYFSVFLKSNRNKPKFYLKHIAMKKIFLILAIVGVVSLLGNNSYGHSQPYPAGIADHAAANLDICHGTSYTTAFTVRGNDVCEGTGYKVAYTIRGNDICFGTGYLTAYTIRGNEICEGTGYTVAFTIRGVSGKDICEGTGYTTAYTIR